MKKLLNKNKRAVSLVWKGIVLAVLGVALASFQNCTQMTEGANDANSKLSEEMEFSYDTMLDQISYMSCPRVLSSTKTSTDNSMFYTFRAGAYRFGGIKLTENFYTTYQKKTRDRMADLLSKSPANSRTVLQLAVRQVGALNSVIMAPGSPLPNVDFSNMFSQLGTMGVLTNLIDAGLAADTNAITGKRVKYLRDGTGLGSHVEGSLNFGMSESLQNSLRTTYLGSSAGLLTMTYLEPTSSGPGGATADMNVRNQSTIMPSKFPSNPGLAYGTGYQVTFAQPPGSPKGFPRYSGTTIVGEELPYPSNLMTSVVERNLLTGAQGTAAQWTCPETLRFRVIRPGDEADPAANCPRVVDRDVNTDAIFAIARNAFRTEDWYINMDRRCIVQKRDSGVSSCYGDRTKILYVQYNLAAPEGCDPNSNDSSNGPTNKACLAWASVCYRTGP